MTNYKTCIYVNVRNEPCIIELIQHYLCLGFDYFIIFDDNSDKPVLDLLIENKMDLSLFSILKNDYYANIKEVYSGNHWATLIVPILKEKNIEYLFHIDADEILYAKNFKNINDLISYYQPFDRLHIDWVIFGDFVKNNDSSSIIHTFKRSEEYLRSCNKGIQGKSICKVSSLETNTIDKHICPHVLKLKENSLHKNYNNELFDIQNNIQIKTMDAPLYLAHYSHQDIENYISRKICSDLHIEVYYNKFVNNEVRKDLLKNLKQHKSDIIECVFNRENFINFKNSKSELGETFFIIVGAAINTYSYVTKLLSIENSSVCDFNKELYIKKNISIS